MSSRDVPNLLDKYENTKPCHWAQNPMVISVAHDTGMLTLWTKLENEKGWPGYMTKWSLARHEKSISRQCREANFQK